MNYPPKTKYLLQWMFLSLLVPPTSGTEVMPELLAGGAPTEQTSCAGYILRRDATLAQAFGSLRPRFARLFGFVEPRPWTESQVTVFCHAHPEIFCGTWKTHCFFQIENGVVVDVGINFKGEPGAFKRWGYFNSAYEYGGGEGYNSFFFVLND